MIFGLFYVEKTIFWYQKTAKFNFYRFTAMICLLNQQIIKNSRKYNLSQARLAL